MGEPLTTVMGIAASEAAMAGFVEITPAHLLIALSRATEPDMVRQLDAVSLRREFELLGIEPRRFRRRLRSLAGTGGHPPPDGPLHRSASCRAVFSWASTIATREDKPLGLEHLLRAAFVKLTEIEPCGMEDAPKAFCPRCGVPVEAVMVNGRRRCPTCAAPVDPAPTAPRAAIDDIPFEL